MAVVIIRLIPLSIFLKVEFPLPMTAATNKNATIAEIRKKNNLIIAYSDRSLEYIKACYGSAYKELPLRELFQHKRDTPL